jgi:CubicO group peptidase (beta-lactamase class C family)
MSDVEGFVAPGFERMAETLAAELAAYPDNGASFAAIRDGDVLAHIWGGWADRAREARWTRETLTPVYSTSKAISSLVIARLAGQGALDFDAPLSALWPEFGAHGKDRVTIAEALSHQAGVPGFPDPIDPDLWLQAPALANALAALAPMWPPGTASGYHPLTWGYIAGEIARRADGRTLGVILREDICAPLGVDFHIGLPDSEHARCARITKPKRFADFGPMTPIKKAAFLTPWAAPTRGGAEWRRVEIPSANGHGTALSVAQLCAALAQGGVIGGAEIISAAGMAGLATQRIAGRDLVLPFDLDWRSGVMGNNLGFYGPNPKALGHSGSGGSCGFGDPALRLSAGYVMNAQSHHLIGDPRPRVLIDALYTCLG